jgi:hypothetical protein
MKQCFPLYDKGQSNYYIEIALQNLYILLKIQSINSNNNSKHLNVIFITNATFKHETILSTL